MRLHVPVVHVAFRAHARARIACEPSESVDHLPFERGIELETWIIVAVIVAVVLIAALVLMRSTKGKRDEQKRHQAHRLRQEAQVDAAQHEREAAAADEQAARARRERAEAEQRAAELERQAEERAARAGDLRGSAEDRLRRADKLDPGK